MAAAVRVGYVWWKYLVFGVLWALLLGPAYMAAFGTWLIGSMLPEFHEWVDIILTVIMASTLLFIMAIAVYTAWHFYHQSRPFSKLIIWLSVGLLGVPLVSTAGAVFSYVQLGVA